MRSAKSLAAEAAQSFRTSADLKTKSTTLKRLAGGIQKLDRQALELDPSEVKVIAQAISILSQAASAYADAGKIKAKAEKEKQDFQKKCEIQVRESRFGDLSIPEKIALLSFLRFDFNLKSSDKGRFEARYAMGRVFEDALDMIAYEMAKRPDAAEDVLERTWQKFRQSLPDLVKRYEELSQRVQALLD